MKKLIYILSVCVVFPSVVIFSSDNHMGSIDTFVLKKEILEDKKIGKNLTDCFRLRNCFSPNKPIFITIDGALHEIKMPTNIQPLILIIPDAQNIIDKHPDIFCAENIKNKISFESQNQSNKTVHATLVNRIIPIDHCTHIKNNGSSIDIVS